MGTYVDTYVPQMVMKIARIVFIQKQLFLHLEAFLHTDC